MISNGSEPAYDAVLIVAFGGPEGMDEVMPFLENVLAGRNVPRSRMLEVAEHYRLFDGVSPLNAQMRALKTALEEELHAHGPHLPVYWGNRNWHPFLVDTLRTMAQDGVRRALALFTSAYSSYSSCRQYREDIIRAKAEVGPSAPLVDKLRVYYNHPGFIEPSIEHVRTALAQIPAARQAETALVFSAHSLPVAMARQSAYERQLREACRLVAEALDKPDWSLVYQSRSGSPHVPWLEPDILDFLSGLQEQGVNDVVVHPIGFISDHMEVLYDLDIEARQHAKQLGLNLVRSATVGVHPAFISMVRELIQERLEPAGARRVLGTHGLSHDVCPPGCCPAGERVRPEVAR